MINHTAGPWWYDRDRTAICYQLPPDSADRFGEDDDGVRDVVNLTSAMGGTDTTADAHLMAAAPDLLNTIKKAVEVHDYDGREGWVAEARAVIAKAEGRS